MAVRIVAGSEETVLALIKTVHKKPACQQIWIKTRLQHVVVFTTLHNYEQKYLLGCDAL
jgi:hypothetical protein